MASSKLLEAYSESDMPTKSLEEEGAEPSLFPDLVRRTESMFQGLELVLTEHKMPVEYVYNLKSQFLDHLLGIPDLLQPAVPFGAEDTQEIEILAERLWNEECKFFLSYPMAKYLKNDPPKPPLSGGFFPSGKLRRWMKARLIAFNPRNTHLWYSFFQAKRACDPFSVELALDMFKDHFEALTKDDPYFDEDNSKVIDEIMENHDFQNVLHQVREKIEESLLVKRRFQIKKTWLSCPQSNHACFQRPRSRGGKVAELRSYAGILPNEEIWHWDDVPDSDVLYDMDFCPNIRGSRGTFHSGVLERRCSMRWEDWESLGEIDLDFLDLEYSYPTKLFWDARVCRKKDCPKIESFMPNFLDHGPTPKWLPCEVRGVLEPLKCRMISKGPALPYALVKPIQETLHTVLRGMPSFRLIGQPFCPTMLYDLIKHSQVTDYWHSIDYKAATDNLSWKLSRSIIIELLKGFPWEVISLCLKVLGPHNLCYPDDKGEVHSWGLQRNGQLMGSILSFPILCLANLGVYLETVKSVQEKLHTKMSKVLINGDDMLFVGPKHLFERHAGISKAVGLELSVGKAYVNNVYANINSTSIHFDLSKTIHDFELFYPKRRRGDNLESEAEPEPEFREVVRLYGRGTPSPRLIGFLNVGLALNKHKVQGKTDEVDRERTCLEKEQLYFDSWFKEMTAKRVIGRGGKLVDNSKKRNYYLSLSWKDLWYEFRLYNVWSRDLLLPDARVHGLFAESHTWEDSRKGIVENIPLLLEGCFGERMKKNVLSFVMNKWSDEIKRQTSFLFQDKVSGRQFVSTRNLFIPSLLGGGGIIPPVGFRFKITKTQMSLVRKCFEDFMYEDRPTRLFEGEKFVSQKILPFVKPHDIYEIAPNFGIVGGKKIKKRVVRSFLSTVRVFPHSCVLY